MKKIDKFSFVSLILSSFFFAASTLSAGPVEKLDKNEMLAIGSATIINGNMAQAKEKAISEALMKGVENYLLRTLGSRVTANNFQRIIDEVLPQARDKVDNFNILAEEHAGEHYKLLVRLRVNEKLIEKGLTQAGVLLSEAPPARVLFLVSEWKEGVPYYWWKDPETHSNISPAELVLHKEFQKRGLSPINRTLRVPDIQYSELLRQAELADSGALEWGKLYSADVVIYGKTEILDGEEALLSLKAVDVNRGVQIAEGMEFEQIEQGIEAELASVQAIEKLVSRLAVRLAPSIIRYSAAELTRVQELKVTLNGLSSYKQFRVFRDFLRRDVAGVNSVRQIRVRKNSISIAVEFQGERSEFVQRVLNHEKLPFAINLDQSEEGVLAFTVI